MKRKLPKKEMIILLAQIVEKRGNLKEVNFARKILGKKPFTMDQWGLGF